MREGEGEESKEKKKSYGEERGLAKGCRVVAVFLCFFHSVSFIICSSASAAKRVESSADLSTLDVKDQDLPSSAPGTPKPEKNHHVGSSDNLSGEVSEASKFKSKNPDFSATKQYKLQLSQGINKFNSSSKKGMRYLIEHGFVENSPEAVAKFLRSNEGLDKTAIGDYLGEA